MEVTVFAFWVLVFYKIGKNKYHNESTMRALKKSLSIVRIEKERVMEEKK